MFEDVENQLLEQIGARVVASAANSPLAALGAGIDEMLDACASIPGSRRSPDRRAGGARLAAVARGRLALRDGADRAGARRRGRRRRDPQQPLRPLAHALLGALDEAVLYVARAEDQHAARAEMAAVLETLVERAAGGAGGVVSAP